MRIKLDENIPVFAAAILRQSGHDVDTVEDKRLGGVDDMRVITAATAEQRALLTLDKGLADIRIYSPGDYAGIILLRPKTNGRSAVLQFITDHLENISGLDLVGRLIVISDAGMRLR